MWGHVGRPGGDAGERVGAGKCFLRPLGEAPAIMDPVLLPTQ